MQQPESSAEDLLRALRAIDRELAQRLPASEQLGLIAYELRAIRALLEAGKVAQQAALLEMRAIRVNLERGPVQT